jgi:ribose/xylose/arabinose/galactoside ABC-type transport system permease subunit
MSNVKEKIKAVTSMRLFLPIVCLIAVLLVNLITTPGFFKISINNGVLYGYVVDIVNRASELVILAVGMTLVTAASGGQDISVGAVMAVAAAVCCQILSGGKVSVDALAAPLALGVVAALLASALCGAFNGFLVAKLNIQPMVATLILFTAGRHCTAHYIRTDHLCKSWFLQSVWWLHWQNSSAGANLFSDHCCTFSALSA